MMHWDTPSKSSNQGSFDPLCPFVPCDHLFLRFLLDAVPASTISAGLEKLSSLALVLLSWSENVKIPIHYAP